MFRVISVWIGLFVVLTLAALHPAAAQDRHAFVVGIDTYTELTHLQRARNDATAIGEAFTRAGFRTELVLDPDERTMLSALSTFAAGLNPGDEVAFFFAGHGVEIDGRNYLLPADIPLVGPGQELIVSRQAVPVSDVIASFNARGVRLSLLILDACRDNPFEAQGTRSLGRNRGLGDEIPPEGTFILFSAGAGQSALDGLSRDDPDPNSVFTRVLAPRITEPGLSLRDMVLDVRSEVRRLGRSVGHDQFPAVYDQLDGSFTFIPAAPGSGGGNTPLAPQAAAPAVVSGDPCVSAMPVWQAVATSENEGILQGFASTYTQTCPPLAMLALAEIESLATYGDVAMLAERDVFEGGPTPEQFDGLRGLAEAGDPTAQTNLGVRYELGQGVPQDFAEAVRWYRRAAEQGFARAQTNLGYMYDEGRGVPQDWNAAREWYFAAAAQDDVRAINNIGYLYHQGRGVPQNFAEAMRAYRYAADRGFARAQTNVGSLYDAGQGVPQDFAEAARWYRLAAEQGLAVAQTSLGYLYDEGLGVPQDWAEARRWYEAAAAQGYARAQSNLGYMYHVGRGVPRNRDEAIRLYRLAAEQGYGQAQTNLNVILNE
jgi:TPR repeat protein